MAMSEVPPASSNSRPSPSDTMRDRIRYRANFQAQDLHVPAARFPYDVIRQNIGRLLKVPPMAKQPISKDMTHSVAWHAHMTEMMFRRFCDDRGLGQLLGPSLFGHESELDYVEFEYLQPVNLEQRGVDWLDDKVSSLVPCGHGTYWETVPWILATGALTPSDERSDLGAREWHGVTGCFMSPDFSKWAGQYSWPCNVFGNKCFYGVGLRAIACDRYLRGEMSRHLGSTTHKTAHERVYEPRGIVLTHIVVTFNRSIAAGAPRSRYFLPQCEFWHGSQTTIRKYPDIRPSVWGDTPKDPEYEAHGRPEGLPINDTNNYDAGISYFFPPSSSLLCDSLVSRE